MCFILLTWLHVLLNFHTYYIWTFVLEPKEQKLPSKWSTSILFSTRMNLVWKKLKGRKVALVQNLLFPFSRERNLRLTKTNGGELVTVIIGSLWCIEPFAWIIYISNRWEFLKSKSDKSSEYHLRCGHTSGWWQVSSAKVDALKAQGRSSFQNSPHPSEFD